MALVTVLEVPGEVRLVESLDSDEGGVQTTLHSLERERVAKHSVVMNRQFHMFKTDRKRTLPEIIRS
jgi:hypothetical protein